MSKPSITPLSVAERNDLDVLVARMLAAGMLPANVVDLPEFRTLISRASRGTYYLPHRTKATELVDSLYDTARGKVLLLLLVLFEA